MATLGDLWQILKWLYISVNLTKLLEMDGNCWKGSQITLNGFKLLKNYMGIGGWSFGSGITRFPSLVVHDMMMMDSMGWPYDSSDCFL